MPRRGAYACADRMRRLPFICKSVISSPGGTDFAVALSRRMALLLSGTAQAAGPGARCNLDALLVQVSEIAHPLLAEMHPVSYASSRESQSKSMASCAEEVELSRDAGLQQCLVEPDGPLRLG
jgi:hypothetical protein